MKTRSLAIATSAWIAPLLLASCATPVDRRAPENECASCHLSDYQEVRRPKHVDVKPVTCAICHSQKAWKPSVVDHPWTLSGAHDGADCFACHTGTPAKFKGTSKKCISCHEDDFERGHGDEEDATTTCQDCHSTKEWEGAKWPEKPPTPDGVETPPDVTSHPSEHVETPPPKPTPTPTPTPTPKPTWVPPKPKPTPTPTVTPTIDPDIGTGPSKKHPGK